MLVPARMKRAVLAVALVATSSGVAAAGGFVGLGIGTSPGFTSDGAELEGDGRSAKLLVGYRFGRISIEGAIGGWDAALESQNSLYSVEMYQGSISGKYSLPLSDGFEAFGRVGLQRTQLNHVDERFNAEGNGFLVGAGMEFRIPTAVTQASVWLDYQFSRTSLEGELTEAGITTRMFTLGVTIGF
jgi:hypothetical protein